jgi:hypothetical protein
LYRGFCTPDVKSNLPGCAKPPQIWSSDRQDWFSFDSMGLAVAQNPKRFEFGNRLLGYRKTRCTTVVFAVTQKRFEAFCRSGTGLLDVQIA